MTLEQATAICRQWLPREHKEHWEPAMKCDGKRWCGRGSINWHLEHDIPMPPATWGLAGAMLEAMKEQVEDIQIGQFLKTDPNDDRSYWYCDIDDKIGGSLSALDAILIASAEWIQAQEK